MTQLSLDRAPEAGDTLICGLTPSGRIDVRPGLTGAPRGVVDCQGVHALPMGSLTYAASDSRPAVLSVERNSSRKLTLATLLAANGLATLPSPPVHA